MSNREKEKSKIWTSRSLLSISTSILSTSGSLVFLTLYLCSTFRVVSAVVGLGLNMLRLKLISQNLVLLQNQKGLLLQLMAVERKRETMALMKTQYCWNICLFILLKAANQLVPLLIEIMVSYGSSSTRLGRISHKLWISKEKVFYWHTCASFLKYTET